MNVAKPAALSAVVVVAMGVSSLLAWPHTAARVPVHWGADGAVDRWGPRWEALALTPVLAAVLALLFALTPALMPARGRLERSAVAYGATWCATLAVLAVVHAVLMAAAVGSPLDVGRVLGVAAGGLLATIGNYLGKVRYNYVFGVRTPWTLADERVWDRTHRTLGPWFMAWGAAVAAASLAVGAPGLAATTVGGAAIVLAAALAVSYREARRVGAA